MRRGERQLGDQMDAALKRNGKHCGQAERRQHLAAGGAHTGNLVHREAIHHHNVAALEGGGKTLFEIGHERCCIHGAIQHERRDHRTTAQAGDEGDRLPMPVRYMVGQPNATRANNGK